MFNLREVKLVMAGLGVSADAFDFSTCTDLHSSAHSVIHYDFTEGYTSGAAVPQDKMGTSTFEFGDRGSWITNEQGGVARKGLRATAGSGADSKPWAARIPLGPIKAALKDVAVGNNFAIEVRYQTDEVATTQGTELDFAMAVGGASSRHGTANAYVSLINGLYKPQELNFGFSYWDTNSDTESSLVKTPEVSPVTSTRWRSAGFCFDAHMMNTPSLDNDMQIFLQSKLDAAENAALACCAPATNLAFCITPLCFPLKDKLLVIQNQIFSYATGRSFSMTGFQDGVSSKLGFLNAKSDYAGSALQEIFTNSWKDDGSEYLYLAPNFDGSVWAGEIYSLSIYKSVITNNSPLELLTKSQEDYLSQLVDHSYQNCPPENSPPQVPAEAIYNTDEDTAFRFSLCGASSWSVPTDACYDDSQSGAEVTLTIDSLEGDAKLFSDSSGSKGAEITQFPFVVPYFPGGRYLWFESAPNKHSFGRDIFASVTFTATDTSAEDATSLPGHVRFIVGPTLDFVIPVDVNASTYPKGEVITLTGVSEDSVLDAGWEVYGVTITSVPSKGTLFPFQFARSQKLAYRSAPYANGLSAGNFLSYDTDTATRFCDKEKSECYLWYEAPEDTSQGSGQLVADQDSFEFVMHQRNAASEYFPALADVNLVPLEAVGTASVQILNYIQPLSPATTQLHEDPTVPEQSFFTFEATLHATGKVISGYDVFITELPEKGELRQFDGTVLSDPSSLPVQCTDSQLRMIFIAEPDDFDVTNYASVGFYLKEKTSGFESPRGVQVLSVQPSNDPIEFGSPVWSGDKTNVLPAFSNLESSRKIVSVPMSDPKDDAEEGQLYEVELTAKNADSSKIPAFIIRMGPNAQTLANADFEEGNGFGGFYKLVIKSTLAKVQLALANIELQSSSVEEDTINTLEIRARDNSVLSRGTRGAEWIRMDPISVRIGGNSEGQTSSFSLSDTQKYAIWGGSGGLVLLCCCLCMMKRKKRFNANKKKLAGQESSNKGPNSPASESLESPGTMPSIVVEKDSMVMDSEHFRSPHSLELGKMPSRRASV